MVNLSYLAPMTIRSGCGDLLQAIKQEYQLEGSGVIRTQRSSSLERAVRGRQGFPGDWRWMTGNPAIRRSAHGPRNGNYPLNLMRVAATALNGKSGSGTSEDRRISG